MATSSMSTAASSPAFEGARIVVVMGVSSSGKTTVGEEMAKALGAPFLDADAYHPKSNIAKMSAGIPLTDEDRWPWLEAMGKALHEAAQKSGIAVGACSALKRVYRDYLRNAAGEPVVYVYLSGSYELIDARIKARKNHFMPESLLRSQFATLEPPGPDENAITVAIDAGSDTVTADALGQLAYLTRLPRGQ